MSTTSPSPAEVTASSGTRATCGRPPGQRSALGEQGFVQLGPVLAPDAVRDTRRRLEAFAAGHAAPSDYGLICHNPWRHVDAARRVIAGALAPLVLELLDAEEIVLFQDIWISKPPGASRVVQWHQDYSYWPLDAWDGVTLWIALDDAGADNGCLHYIPGTHLLGEKHPADFFAGTPQPRRPHLPPLEAESRAREAVSAPVAAGEALAHHPLTWHMSPANASERPRRAWSLTWILPSVRWDPGHAPHPFNHYLQPTAGEAVRGEHFLRARR